MRLVQRSRHCNPQSHGGSRRDGAAIRRRELTMVATVALFLEYELVLTRPEHLAKAGITVAEAEIVPGVLQPGLSGSGEEVSARLIHVRNAARLTGRRLNHS